MKRKSTLFAVAALAAFGLSNADPAVIVDDNLGLSHVSVFDTAVPDAFDYPTVDPKDAGVLPRSWEDAPPQIPHRIDKYLPLNAQQNKCLDCHEEPDKIGKKAKGKPTPMSETHYVKEGDELVLANRRYVCTLCHTPQANVNTLVDNTFKGD
ncbi:MAG TPA: nitrate reductase cytochrome c-type subunit [Thiobacillaceae bacterium]|nr:nitrate reductase cytochrome c-type subunit [Thiobacillaceae bacterium]HNU64324.1 nitrate reductase cytochrome c-type subunit [Thiobacillaceae bacterium]